VARKRHGIVRREEHARLAVHDRLGYAADVGRHHGQARRAGGTDRPARSRSLA
jgi:hypothetical protein